MGVGVSAAATCSVAQVLRFCSPHRSCLGVVFVHVGVDARLYYSQSKVTRNLFDRLARALRPPVLQYSARPNKRKEGKPNKIKGTRLLLRPRMAWKRNILPSYHTPPPPPPPPPPLPQASVLEAFAAAGGGLGRLRLARVATNDRRERPARPRDLRLATAEGVSITRIWTSPPPPPTLATFVAVPPASSTMARPLRVGGVVATMAPPFPLLAASFGPAAAATAATAAAEGDCLARARGECFAWYMGLLWRPRATREAREDMRRLRGAVEVGCAFVSLTRWARSDKRPISCVRRHSNGAPYAKNQSTKATHNKGQTERKGTEQQDVATVSCLNAPTHTNARTATYYQTHCEGFAD